MKVNKGLLDDVDMGDDDILISRKERQCGNCE